MIEDYKEKLQLRTDHHMGCAAAALLLGPMVGRGAAA